MSGTSATVMDKVLFYIVIVVLPICCLIDLLGSAGSGCEALRGSGLFVVEVLNVVM